MKINFPGRLLACRLIVGTPCKVEGGAVSVYLITQWVGLCPTHHALQVLFVVADLQFNASMMATERFCSICRCRDCDGTTLLNFIMHQESGGYGAWRYDKGDAVGSKRVLWLPRGVEAFPGRFMVASSAALWEKIVTRLQTGHVVTTCWCAGRSQYDGVPGVLPWRGRLPNWSGNNTD